MAAAVTAAPPGRVSAHSPVVRVASRTAASNSCTALRVMITRGPPCARVGMGITRGPPLARRSSPWRAGGALGPHDGGDQPGHPRHQPDAEEGEEHVAEGPLAAVAE